HFSRRIVLPPLLPQSPNGNLYGRCHLQKSGPCPTPSKRRRGIGSIGCYRVPFFLCNHCCPRNFPERNGASCTRYLFSAAKSSQSVAIRLLPVHRNRRCRPYYPYHLELLN